MADDIENKPEETPEPIVEETKPDAPLNEDKPNYEALAKAEKARADAAEALLIKNKAIAKRAKDGDELPDEDKPITKKDLEAFRASLTPVKEEESPEEKALKEAKEKLETVNAELVRALKGKSGINTNPAGTHQDPPQGDMPKISANDSKGLKSAGYEWDGVKRVWKKKLGNGQYLYAKDLKSPTWIE